jgi:hypothetical protein
LRTDQPGEVEHQCVDQKRTQPEGQNEQRAGNHGQDWPDERVDQAEDQGEPDNLVPLSELRINPPPGEQINRRVEGYRVDPETNNQFSHG